MIKPYNQDYVLMPHPIESDHTLIQCVRCKSEMGFTHATLDTLLHFANHHERFGCR